MKNSTQRELSAFPTGLDRETGDMRGTERTADGGQRSRRGLGCTRPVVSLPGGKAEVTTLVDPATGSACWRTAAEL